MIRKDSEFTSSMASIPNMLTDEGEIRRSETMVVETGGVTMKFGLL